MKSEKLISISVTIILLLSLPVLASANAVTWSSEQYTAYANGGGPAQIDYGVPAMVSSGSRFGTPPVEATAEITANSMYINTHLYGADNSAAAYARFDGTYSAQANTPLFLFTYSLGYSSNLYSYPSSSSSAWLTIYDVTDSTNLYSELDLSLTGTPSVISVSTTAGHTIDVSFGVSTSYYSVPSGGVALNLSYSTAVAPEPISSILFVTGGTLLAGRRYIKRKKKA